MAGVNEGDFTATAKLNTTDFHKNMVEMGYISEKTGKKIDKSMNNTGKSTGKLSGILSKIKGNYLAIGGVITGLIAVGKKFIDLNIKQAKSELQLRTALKNTGSEIGGVTKDWKKYATELQAATGQGDEVTLQLMAQAKMMGVENSSMKEIIQTATDLSAAYGIGLQTALRGTVNLYKGNVGQLSRYIPALTELNKKGASTAAMMDVVSKSVAGSAAAVADASGGLLQMQAAFGDLGEAIGGVLLPMLKPVIKLLTVFFQTTEKIVKAVTWLVKQIELYGSGILGVKQNMQGLSDAEMEVIMRGSLMRESFRKGDQVLKNQAGYKARIDAIMQTGKSIDELSNKEIEAAKSSLKLMQRELDVRVSVQAKKNQLWNEEWERYLAGLKASDLEYKSVQERIKRFKDLDKSQRSSINITKEAIGSIKDKIGEIDKLTSKNIKMTGWQDRNTKSTITGIKAIDKYTTELEILISKYELLEAQGAGADKLTANLNAQLKILNKQKKEIDKHISSKTTSLNLTKRTIKQWGESKDRAKELKKQQGELNNLKNKEIKLSTRIKSIDNEIVKIKQSALDKELAAREELNKLIAEDQKKLAQAKNLLASAIEADNAETQKQTLQDTLTIVQEIANSAISISKSFGASDEEAKNLEIILTTAVDTANMLGVAMDSTAGIIGWIVAGIKLIVSIFDDVINKQASVAKENISWLDAQISAAQAEKQSEENIIGLLEDKLTWQKSLLDSQKEGSEEWYKTKELIAGVNADIKAQEKIIRDRDDVAAQNAIDQLDYNKEMLDIENELNELKGEEVDAEQDNINHLKKRLEAMKKLVAASDKLDPGEREERLLEQKKTELELEKAIQAQLQAQNAERDAANSKLLENLQTQINLGMIDVENISGVGRIQSVIRQTGQTGIEAAASLQGFGVTGQTLRNVSNVNNISIQNVGATLEESAVRANNIIRSVIDE